MKITQCQVQGTFYKVHELKLLELRVQGSEHVMTDLRPTVSMQWLSGRGFRALENQFGPKKCLVSTWAHGPQAQLPSPC